MPRGPVVAVVGPTAAGKSDLGIALALALGGEVVNADSMQLYRGMDIGTAKVRLDERRGVPHHLLDVWDVTHAADVASFQRDARRVIDALLAAGRVPVLVGGSGLYVRAALDDLSFSGTDPVVRARWEAELTRRGSGELHAELARRAPRAAEAILPSNGRRIVRALEVVELTGDYAATLPEQRAVYDVVQIGVDRDDLDERITQRVDRMWNAGFPEEVRQLVECGLREGRTASRALGYAQLLAWMDGAMESTDQAKLATISATRRFARRQRSWFRRDNRISWLNQPDVTQALRLVVRSDG